MNIYEVPLTIKVNPMWYFISGMFIRGKIKVALGVCFALKSWKEYLLLFTDLITLGKDVTFRLSTIFKTNRSLSYSSANQIPN